MGMISQSGESRTLAAVLAPASKVSRLSGKFSSTASVILKKLVGRVSPDPSVELCHPKGPSDHTDTASATESGKRVDFNSRLH
jgi:hypothetical protein